MGTPERENHILKAEGMNMKTRFQRELSGDLGAFWQRQTETELAKVKADLDSGEITIDEAGVARNCIGRALMDDLLEKLLLVTDKADSAATRAAREAEVQARPGILPGQQKGHQRRGTGRDAGCVRRGGHGGGRAHWRGNPALTHRPKGDGPEGPVPRYTAA